MGHEDRFFADIEAQMLKALDAEDYHKTNTPRVCFPSGPVMEPQQGLITPHPQPAKALLVDPEIETQSYTGQQHPPHKTSAAPLLLSTLVATLEPTSGHVASVKGPCFLKMLVPDYVAGAIIGRNGTTISYIERSSQCQLRVSAAGEYFPGTRDRVLVAGGTINGLERCAHSLLEQLFSQRAKGEGMVKLVLPNSSISAVIGPNGRTVRSLAQRTGCRINATARVDKFLERLVVLSGQREPLLRAVLEVCRAVQTDLHLCDHLHVAYTLELPLGTWLGDSALPKDAGEVLLHPEDAQGCGKRELLQYLLRAAPRGLLLEQGIGGRPENVLKSKSKRQLFELVEVTWHAREAQGPTKVPQGGQAHA